MDNLEIVLMTIDELVDNGYALDGPSGPALPCVQLKRAPLEWIISSPVPG